MWSLRRCSSSTAASLLRFECSGRHASSACRMAAVSSSSFLLRTLAVSIARRTAAATRSGRATEASRVSTAIGR